MRIDRAVGALIAAWVVTLTGCQSPGPVPTRPDPPPATSPSPTERPTPTPPAPTPTRPITPPQGMAWVQINKMAVGQISADRSVAYTGSQDGVATFAVIETGEHILLRADESVSVDGVTVTLISAGDSATLQIPKIEQPAPRATTWQQVTLKAGDSIELDDGSSLTLLSLADRTVEVTYRDPAGDERTVQVGAHGTEVGAAKLTLLKLNPSPATGATATEASLEYAYPE
ncbi:hypothetical protein [Tessaracoccus aquimaris]|nr:hypothetical protein [Tessaracoccus aquimaris]